MASVHERIFDAVAVFKIRNDKLPTELWLGRIEYKELTCGWLKIPCRPEARVEGMAVHKVVATSLLEVH